MSEIAKVTAKTPEPKTDNSASKTKKLNFSPSINSPIDQILFLQRTVGNQAVQRLLKSGVIQAKLTIGPPGDIYEQEADRVADQVMRMPDLSKAQSKRVSEYNKAPSIQRACTECEEELQRRTQNSEPGHPPQEELYRQPIEEEKEEFLQTKEVFGSTPEVNSVAESQINSIRGGGQPLPAAANYFFSSRMGYDFSNVKVHDNKDAAESAKDINAKAYTIGNNIVFNEGHYNTGTLEGKKLLAHELVHVIQNNHNRIMPDELPKQNITKWQSLVTKGYEEENKNPGGMETNFIDALKLIGESKVNIARDGYNNTTKLKAGLNLDILYTKTPGTTGFLTDKGFTGRLPLDGTYPDSAIIIGRNAFLTNSPVNTIMVVEHEKTHFSHQRNSVSLLKEWEKKADMTKFQKEFKKQKAEFEKFAKSSSMKPSEIETGLAEIKARIIEKWFRSKKRKDKVELELFSESIGTMKAAHFDSEVLSGLAGFMKGFHLIEIKNGVPAQDLFFELTGYPAEKGFWTLNSRIVKEHYKKTLTDYYCNKLNETQRKAFDKHVADYKDRKWSHDATEYFKMLQSITCKK